MNSTQTSLQPQLSESFQLSSQKLLSKCVALDDVVPLPATSSPCSDGHTRTQGFDLLRAELLTVRSAQTQQRPSQNERAGPPCCGTDTRACSDGADDSIMHPCWAGTCKFLVTRDLEPAANVLNPAKNLPPINNDLLEIPRGLRRSIGSAIRDFNMIRNGDRVLVGLSGGKDSLTLLHALRVRGETAYIDGINSATNQMYSVLLIVKGGKEATGGG